MSDNTIFTQKISSSHKEPFVQCDSEEFDKLIKARRSVRVFTDEILPEYIIDKAIEHALLAPNSSNLQPWEFHVVSSEDKKRELAKHCFSQNGAMTASHLIVCVARTDTWKENAKQIMETLKKENEQVPAPVAQYYEKIIPFSYGNIGPFGIISPLKWLMFNILGLSKPFPREPIFPNELKTWAIKSTALACQNLMLSLRSMNCDSLAMEGFDRNRVKKMFSFGRHHHITMVIAAGKRAEDGIFGRQLRLPKEKFIYKY